MDVNATHHIDCGKNSGCLKIFYNSSDGVQIKRDCFLLKVPDLCYTKENGLKYCWCMWEDFCNSSNCVNFNVFILTVVPMMNKFKVL